MPKYWGKQIFTHGRFPEVGQKQKTEKRKRRKERLNDGNNNGQATHGARKHTHASRLGQKFLRGNMETNWVKQENANPNSLTLDLTIQFNLF